MQSQEQTCEAAAAPQLDAAMLGKGCMLFAALAVAFIVYAAWRMWDDGRYETAEGRVLSIEQGCILAQRRPGPTASPIPIHSRMMDCDETRWADEIDEQGRRGPEIHPAARIRFAFVSPADGETHEATAETIREDLLDLSPGDRFRFNAHSREPDRVNLD